MTTSTRRIIARACIAVSLAVIAVILVFGNRSMVLQFTTTYAGIVSIAAAVYYLRSTRGKP